MPRAVADEFSPEVLREAGVSKRQYHISAGDSGRAYRVVFDIMKRARTALCIADSYADESLGPFVESLDAGVRIRVLGGGTKPVFKRIWDGYRTSGRNVDFRSNKILHDRYLIIDGSEVWSLGGSINGLGKKAHTIQRVDDQTERDKVITDFESAWGSGTPL